MNKNKILSADEIGRGLVDFTKTRDTDNVNKYELLLLYGGKLAGTLYLSVKYESVLNKPQSPQEETSKGDTEIPPELLLNFANENQDFEAYSPEDEKCESFEEIKEVGYKSDSKEIKSDSSKDNLTYHKRFLYFVPKSYKIYEFDEESKSFYDVSIQTEIIHPSEVQTTELPDGSYLLTGGRDATTKVLTSAVVQYFEGSYFRRADIPTGRVEHSTVYMKGFVYGFGGYNDEGIIKQVDIYDMNNDLWIPLIEMKKPKYRASIGKFANKFIYLFGGGIDFEANPFCNLIEKFDIQHASSELLSVTLPSKLSGMAGVQKDEDSILIMGGNRFSVKNKVYKFNTKKSEFKHLSDLPKAVGTVHPPYIINSKIYIFGAGKNEDSFPEIVTFSYNLA